MKLARFEVRGRPRIGVVAGEGLICLTEVGFGYSDMLRGNLSAALSNFRKAKSLDPGNVVVGNNLQILANAAAARA